MCKMMLTIVFIAHLTTSVLAVATEGPAEIFAGCENLTAILAVYAAYSVAYSIRYFQMMKRTKWDKDDINAHLDALDVHADLHFHC